MAALALTTPAGSQLPWPTAIVPRPVFIAKAAPHPALPRAKGGAPLPTFLPLPPRGPPQRRPLADLPKDVVDIVLAFVIQPAALFRILTRLTKRQPPL